MSDEQKSVLVTGCSSGLGSFVASYLRGKGWRVIATVRNEPDAIRLRNDGIESILLDLDSSDSVGAAVDGVLEMTGGALAGLVNNAGIEFLGALEDLSREELRRCFETNVFGTMELTSRLIPTFRRQHFGRVVFVSASNSNGFGYPFLGPGNASKNALEVLATTLGRELHGTGISVSTVCPDELPTDLLVNTLRRSSRVVAGEESHHARSYLLLRQAFSRGPAAALRHKLLLVAQAIERLLASERPARRIVVPLSAKLHYMAHMVLPEWLQDRLLFRAMKQGLGIEL